MAERRPHPNPPRTRGGGNGVVILTTADTEILALSNTLRSLPADFPPVRAANPASLSAAEVDRLLAEDVAQAGVVLVRLLGGVRTWEGGFRRLAARCRERAVPLVALPGDQQPDAELAAACTAQPDLVRRSFEYLLHGGTENVRSLLVALADACLGTSYGAEPPRALPWEGVYRPVTPVARATPPLSPPQAGGRQRRPTVALLFYRAHWMSGNLDWIDALIAALEARGANVLPLFCYSLFQSADGAANDLPPLFRDYLFDQQGNARVDVIVNTLSFAMARVMVDGPALATGWSTELLDRLNVPVLQAVVSTGSRDRWAASPGGLSPIDTAMNVAMPEFDGRIITVPACFKEAVQDDPRLGGPVLRYVPDPERIDFVARLAVNWARLRRTPNQHKKVALILSSYPTRNARIGNAVGLDTPASVVNILRGLRKASYTVDDVPESGDEMIHRLIERGTYDTEFLTRAQALAAPGRIGPEQYGGWFEALPDSVQARMVTAWGEAPGAVYNTSGALMVPGLVFGNVFVGIQPPRGFGENPVAIYHSPDLAPTHHYLAFYRWLRDDFGAHAVVHVGKHGTLEWLPGKSVGLSAECYPDVVLSDLPHFYPFIVNNPGEGAQAKRRAHATIVDHLIPPMAIAETYNELMALEQLMDEYYQVQTLDPTKLPIIRRRIWELIRRARLDRDLGAAQMPDNFDSFLLHVDGYLCELKDAQIRDGLHILGQPPQGEQEVGLLLALTRLDNPGAPSLRGAIARAAGLDYRALQEDRGRLFPGPLPLVLDGHPEAPPVRSQGDVIERIEALGERLVSQLQAAGFDSVLANQLADQVERPLPPRKQGGRKIAPSPPQAGGIEGGSSLMRSLRYITDELHPNLRRTTDEIGNLLRGLDGGYVPAGPSGAPTRGLANVLPTGRNFYSVDPNTIPSPAAWEVGQGLAEALLARYLEEQGHYPETVGLVIWGTSAMRTHGDDVAEVLWLLGVRPIWQAENRRVRGLEVIPLAELGRPRIDVTLRISGFFRDAFPNLIHLLDEAIESVARLDEPDEANYLAKHIRRDLARRREVGEPDAQARQQSLYRIFGSKPGTYGAGILPLLDERNWSSDQDLAAVYTAWGCYAYTRAEYGREAPAEFQARFGQIVVAAKNQDNREHDIFDSDDYMQFHGGMIATIRALSGQDPQKYFGDSADPGNIRVRDLADEARRVFRSRVVNPKWINAMKRHGYKGAFELAATTDYLYGYDATAQVVDDWMYERLAQSYVLDPEIQTFFQERNPWALRGIIERLFEAIDRQLWENPPPEMQESLRRVYLDTEASLEGEIRVEPPA